MGQSTSNFVRWNTMMVTVFDLIDGVAEIRAETLASLASLSVKTAVPCALV